MIDSLKELLKCEYWTTSAGNTAELTDGTNRKNRWRVNLTDLSSDALIIDLPPGGPHSILLKEGRYVRSCDYLIIVPQDHHTNVYFIEMKKTLSSEIPRDACDQIRCSVPLFDYLASSATIHFQSRSKINKYFVVIAERRHPALDKQGVKPEIYQTHLYKGQKFRIIHSSEIIPFHHLS